MENVSRRRFLAGLGVAAAGAVVGGGGVVGAQQVSGATSDNTVAFYGRHQSGIITAQQNRLCFAAFDITSTATRADVVQMLQDWTDASAKMTAGQSAGAVAADVNAPPEDTGEALGLGAANLTLTFGFGSSVFSKAGVDRFGIAHLKPAALVDIPPFRGDQLDPNISDGDICVQACADDPQVAFHAVRNLARIGRGTVILRWNQLGFGPTAKTTRGEATPRNLMGNKDGTNNLQAEDTALVANNVWVNNADQPWMENGSYLVARRIRMLLEVWDRAGLGDQEQTIGRHKISGAPLGKTNEHDVVPLSEVSAAGTPVIPVNAHIRLAAPASNDNVRILRRGYSFTDGITDLGQLDAGLFFIAYQNDPRTHFISIQRQLSQNDALNEYIQHTSSALFAVPGGLSSGESIGGNLFA